MFTKLFSHGLSLLLLLSVVSPLLRPGTTHAKQSIKTNTFNDTPHGVTASQAFDLLYEEGDTVNLFTVSPVSEPMETHNINYETVTFTGTAYADSAELGNELAGVTFSGCQSLGPSGSLGCDITPSDASGIFTMTVTPDDGLSFFFGVEAERYGHFPDYRQCQLWHDELINIADHCDLSEFVLERSGCTVSYDAQRLDYERYQGHLSVRNDLLPDIDLDEWELTFSFPTEQQIITLEGANDVQVGRFVTLTQEVDDQFSDPTFSVGESLTMTFEAEYEMLNIFPTNFELNGNRCQLGSDPRGDLYFNVPDTVRLGDTFDIYIGAHSYIYSADLYGHRDLFDIVSTQDSPLNGNGLITITLQATQTGSTVLSAIVQGDLNCVPYSYLDCSLIESYSNDMPITVVGSVQTVLTNIFETTCGSVGTLSVDQLPFRLVCPYSAGHSFTIELHELDGMTCEPESTISDSNGIPDALTIQTRPLEEWCVKTEAFNDTPLGVTAAQAFDLLYERGIENSTFREIVPLAVETKGQTVTHDVMTSFAHLLLLITLSLCAQVRVRRNRKQTPQRRPRLD